MPTYEIKSKLPSWAGESIGILVLNCAYPFVPGNVANATTYPFPVRFHEIEGSTAKRLLDQRDPELLNAFIEGAMKLEAEGVRAITGACGFMALFQQEVANSVDVPVFLSSLMQAPFIARTLKKGQKIGVISAKASVLTGQHLRNAGITDEMPLVIYGMEGKQEFLTSVLEQKGSMDTDQTEKEIVEVCEVMLKENPETAAILLECSDLPPFSSAIHAYTGLPVFDFITMIKYVHSALVPSKYSDGYM